MATPITYGYNIYGGGPYGVGLYTGQGSDQTRRAYVGGRVIYPGKFS